MGCFNTLHVMNRSHQLKDHMEGIDRPNSAIVFLVFAMLYVRKRVGPEGWFRSQVPRVHTDLIQQHQHENHVPDKAQKEGRRVAYVRHSSEVECASYIRASCFSSPSFFTTEFITCSSQASSNLASLLMKFNFSFENTLLVNSGYISIAFAADILSRPRTMAMILRRISRARQGVGSEQ